jgi:predicted Zn-dependent protease
VFPVPKDLERLVAEIDGWLDLRCPDKALDRLQPLLSNPEARPVGLAMRVRAYVSTKRHREAVADLDELRTTPYDPDWLDLTEAWCRKRLQDLPGAVRCMQQLLYRNPRSAIGHFNLGCYLALSGDKERALDEVSIACGLDESFRAMLHDEVDLVSLRQDHRYQELAAGHAAEESAEEIDDDTGDALSDEESAN